MAGSSGNMQNAPTVQDKQTAQNKTTVPLDASRTYKGGIAALIDFLILVIFTGGGYYIGSYQFAAIGFIFSLILVLALSVRVLSEWNRKAVLRFGRYKGIIGPGIFLIIPIVDSTTMTIDTRVLSTSFKAEKTLTKDNVPVDVDAILFWQVKEVERSVLNVQSYYNSVLLAAQTAMRDIIGKSELATMLAGRDIIGEDIKGLIEERIRLWGTQAISVEIRDVTIPPELQSAMARVATSDREKQARVILAESESLAADKMIEASHKYESDPWAMQLRALNMMYEVSINGKNVMVFIPTETKGLAMPIPFGVRGINDYVNELQKKQGQGQKKPKPQPQKKPDDDDEDEDEGQ